MKRLLRKMRYLAVAVCVVLAGCYAAEPIEAWIVDAENGQPVEGVVVMANWQLKGGMEGGNDVGQLMVMETVTDKKGDFVFPGWGPKFAVPGGIKADRPQYLIFKTGYKPLRLSNHVTSDYGYSIVLKSEWNGKTIKLDKAAAGPKDHLEEFRFFNDDLETIIRDYKTCEWKRMPNMLREVRKQRLELTAQAITSGAGD